MNVGPSRRVRLLIIATAMIVLGTALLLVDLQVARWCKSEKFPDLVLWLLNSAERMANGKDVAAILACMLFLDPALRKVWAARGLASQDERRAFPRIVVAAFGSGLVVQSIKAAVTRIRPRLADLDALPNSLATFGGFTALESASRYDQASFPSGHAAVASGFAAALCWRYPHASPLFIAAAVAASLQRVVALAHYPSDICFGAAIGLLVAAAILPSWDDPRHSDATAT